MHNFDQKVSLPDKGDLKFLIFPTTIKILYNNTLKEKLYCKYGIQTL
jgi:hypothetical protein